MRRMMLSAALTGAFLAGAAAVTTPAQAYDIDARDSSANRSRTFKAYERDRGTLFEIFFDTTRWNEERRVRANLNITMPSTASDELLVAYARIWCAPVGGPIPGGVNKISNSENILRRVGTLSLRPKYVYTAGAPGRYRCWLYLQSGRPRPSGERSSSNVWTVRSGSYIEATTALPDGADQGYYPSSRSPVVEHGSAYDAAPLAWTAPPGVGWFAVSGDVWLTTCSAVGGSTDPVTGEKLCEGRVARTGSTVNTRIVVGQYNKAGTGYCKLTYDPDSGGLVTYISIDVHHMMLYKSVGVRVSTDPDCSRQFRIKVYVKHLRGAAVVIHQQGTITAALP